MRLKTLKIPGIILVLLWTAVICTGCATSRHSRGNYGGPDHGMASWYGNEYAGRKTASGESFNPNDLTAAHRNYPFNTIVRVTRTDTGDKVDVRINDRGPFVDGRIIDVSYEAARRIRMIGKGTVPVKLKVLKKP